MVPVQELPAAATRGRARSRGPRQRPHEPTDADLGELSGYIRDTLGNADPAQCKALVNALVAEVRVESREAIWPVFRIPDDTPDRFQGSVVDPIVSGSTT